MTASPFYIAFFPRLLLAVALALPFCVANAQGPQPGDPLLTTSSGLSAADEQRLILPVIRIERENGQRDFQGLYGGQTTDVNFGLEFTPLNNLSLRADAWSIEDRQAPLMNRGQAGSWQAQNSPPLLEQAVATDVSGFNLDQPFLGGDLESRGIDLGASYFWETDRAGRFTLETSATYIQDFNQRNELTDAVGFIEEETRLPGTPDLQGSLTFTWEFGNHTASAVTNYFDSFKDISELNIEEINELVEDITTVDLQYGYNVTTGKQDRAVVSFSFGIRNIFDRKTTQILNQNSRVVDQNGRVAYGSIKYQF